jgi:Flp pilus assembly pilin Flp
VLRILPQTPAGRGNRRFGRRLGRLLSRARISGDAGQALVEYSLVILFVALVAVAALSAIGASVSDFIASAANGV